MDLVVSSFYRYVPIEDLQEFRDNHQKYCNDLGIKGKILVGKEGINGTISGSKEQIDSYEENLHKDIRFKEVQFKRNISDFYPFKKITVRIREEVVTSKFNISLDKTGKHISPKELKKMLDNKDDLILLDARNDYEWKIGKFKNAITPEINVFKDFTKVPGQLKEFKDKKIVMYCTGGIRCEKASALMIKEGFRDVNQLEGGILNYIEQYPDTHFEGRLFVFDNRLSIPTGEKTKDISLCEYCNVECGRYINCSNKQCDRLFLCCEDCDKQFKHTCSKFCLIVTRNN